jgi:hypothetical protein
MFVSLPRSLDNSSSLDGDIAKKTLPITSLVIRSGFVYSMRLLSSFGLLGLVLASSETQKTLPVHEHQSASPLDSSFDQKVEWALKHFNIPGLAVAVSHGETYSKVSR